MMCRIILSGPFCTGKTSIMERLKERYSIPKLIDDTTRPRRLSEQLDFPYHFISESEFQKRASCGYYFETATCNGYHYGVPKKLLFEQERWSLDILSSSWYLYKDLPGVIGIYLEPPSIEELRRRARLRGDSQEAIEQRIQLFLEEEESSMPYRICSCSLEQMMREIAKILPL
jgi:guanylate kinase